MSVYFSETWSLWVNDFRTRPIFFKNNNFLCLTACFTITLILCLPFITNLIYLTFYSILDARLRGHSCATYNFQTSSQFPRTYTFSASHFIYSLSVNFIIILFRLTDGTTGGTATPTGVTGTGGTATGTGGTGGPGIRKKRNELHYSSQSSKLQMRVQPSKESAKWKHTVIKSSIILLFLALH